MIGMMQMMQQQMQQQMLMLEQNNKVMAMLMAERALRSEPLPNEAMRAAGCGPAGQEVAATVLLTPTQESVNKSLSEPVQIHLK